MKKTISAGAILAVVFCWSVAFAQGVETPKAAAQGGRGGERPQLVGAGSSANDAGGKIQAGGVRLAPSQPAAGALLCGGQRPDGPGDCPSGQVCRDGLCVPGPKSVTPAGGSEPENGSGAVTDRDVARTMPETPAANVPTKCFGRRVIGSETHIFEIPCKEVGIGGSGGAPGTAVSPKEADAEVPPTKKPERLEKGVQERPPMILPERPEKEVREGPVPLKPQPVVKSVDMGKAVIKPGTQGTAITQQPEHGAVSDAGDVARPAEPGKISVVQVIPSDGSQDVPVKPVFQFELQITGDGRTVFKDFNAIIVDVTKMPDNARVDRGFPRCDALRNFTATCWFSPSSVPLEYNADYRGAVLLAQTSSPNDDIVSTKEIYSWKFKTAGEPNVLQPIVSFSSPRVQATIPVGNGTNESVSGAIVVEFNQPMNENKTSGAFSIKKESDGSAVSVSAACQPDTNCKIMIFRPAALLANSSRYIARVDTSAMSVNSMPLAEEYSWRFATAALLPDAGGGTAVDGQLRQEDAGIEADTDVMTAQPGGPQLICGDLPGGHRQNCPSGSECHSGLCVPTSAPEGQPQMPGSGSKLPDKKAGGSRTMKAGTCTNNNDCPYGQSCVNGFCERSERPLVR